MLESKQKVFKENVCWIHPVNTNVLKWFAFLSFFLSFFRAMLAHVTFNSFVSCVWCSLSATVANGDYKFTIVIVFPSLPLIHLSFSLARSLHSHSQRNEDDILINNIELCASCAILSRHWLWICDSKEISKIVMK